MSKTIDTIKLTTWDTYPDWLITLETALELDNCLQFITQDLDSSENLQRLKAYNIIISTLDKCHFPIVRRVRANKPLNRATPYALFSELTHTNTTNSSATLLQLRKKFNNYTAPPSQPAQTTADDLRILFDRINGCCTSGTSSLTEGDLTMQFAQALDSNWSLFKTDLLLRRNHLQHANTFADVLNAALLYETTLTQEDRPTQQVLFTSNNNQRKPNNIRSRTRSCIRCGKTNHHPSNCPALKSTCSYCHIIGHIEKACLKKKRAELPHDSVNFF